MRLPRVLLVFATVAALMGAAGVGLRAAEGSVVAVPDAAQLVGEIDGSDLYLAVVAEQRRAVAFRTDGKKVGVWMAGSVRDQQVTLRDNGGGSLTLQLKSRAGTLRLAGQPERRVSLDAATAGAGLYRLDRRSLSPTRTLIETTGWIVLGDGSVRGVRRVDRSGGAVTFFAAGKVAPGAQRVTPESLLPSCKPVRRSRPGAPTTEPPGCGLPDGRAAPTPSSTYTATRNPKAAGFTQEQLRAAFDRAEATTVAVARSRGYRGATAADRRAFEPWVKSVRASKRVIGAADGLRSALQARNYGSISNRLADYEAALATLPLPSTLRGRSASMRQALPTSGPLDPRPRPSAPPASSVVVPGADFALASELEQTGLFVSWAHANAVLQASGTIYLDADASVGWHSTGDGRAVAIGKFKVPAGVREVELELDGVMTANVRNSECTGGFASGRAGAGIWIERISATGATDETVASRYYDDWSGIPPLCPPPPIPMLPVPDPLSLIVPGPYYETFSPPASGGAYQIKFSVSAKAETVGVGDAYASAYMFMHKVTVRFHR